MEYANSFEGKGVESDELKEIIRLAIIDGAKWADAHPKEPSLPSDLDEAAQKVEDYYDVGEEHGYLCCHRGDIKDAFKACAEWMAGQGETHELTIESPVLGPPMICCPVHANNGDKVIVQIRKTEGQR